MSGRKVVTMTSVNTVVVVRWGCLKQSHPAVMQYVSHVYHEVMAACVCVGTGGGLYACHSLQG